MHYESGLVLPNEVIEDVYIIGERTIYDTFILPLKKRNGNQIYDRGKKFWWPRAIICII